MDHIGWAAKITRMTLNFGAINHRFSTVIVNRMDPLLSQLVITLRTWWPAWGAWPPCSRGRPPRPRPRAAASQPLGGRSRQRRAEESSIWNTNIFGTKIKSRGWWLFSFVLCLAWLQKWKWNKKPWKGIWVDNSTECSILHYCITLNGDWRHVILLRNRAT